MARLPAFAQQTARTRVLLLVCTGLTFDDWHDNAYSNLYHRAENGAIGLMNTAVNGPKTPASTLKMLETGLPDVPVVQFTRPQADAPFGIVDDWQAIAEALEDNAAPFARAELNDVARAESARSQLSPQAYHEARRAALHRLDVLLYVLAQGNGGQGRDALDVLIVSPCPPTAFGKRAGEGERLAPIVAWGPDFAPGLLTSPTTRTAGLVANIDAAPTILRLLGIPVPASSTGRSFRSEAWGGSGAARVARLARMNFVVWQNGRSLTAVMPALVTGCFLCLVAGMVAYRRGGARATRWFAPLLVFTLAMPLALLFAPLGIPPTLWEYGLRMVAWMLALTLLAYGAARWLRVSPPLIVAALTVGTVVLDTLVGQPLLKESVLSNYPLSGIRYYGIGNEYFGVVLVFALVGGFLALDDRDVPFPPQSDTRGARRGLLLFWLALAFVLGWPVWGANAGSLAATGAGFGVGAALLSGRRATWRLAVASVAGGLLLAFAFGLIDGWLARQGLTAGASHSGAALDAASHGGGAAYLAGIALRKIAMNFRLFFSFWFLLIVLMFALLGLLGRWLVGDALRTLLQRKPWTRAGTPALAVALVASLLFKDSGVVTVAFLLGGTVLLLLWYVFTTPEMQSDADAPAKS